jgi:hypothetical protein
MVVFLLMALSAYLAACDAPPTPGPTQDTIHCFHGENNPVINPSAGCDFQVLREVDATVYWSVTPRTLDSMACNYNDLRLSQIVLFESIIVAQYPDGYGPPSVAINGSTKVHLTPGPWGMYSDSYCGWFGDVNAPLGSLRSTF